MAEIKSTLAHGICVPAVWLVSYVSWLIVDVKAGEAETDRQTNGWMLDLL